MALSAANRTTIQNWLTNAWATVQNRQAAYFGTHGRYRQFLVSHTVHPQNATATAPDNLAARPTDVANDGESIANLNGASWPVSITVDVYDGPAGRGYVATARARGSAGEVWEVARQHGPESWRAFALRLGV